MQKVKIKSKILDIPIIQGGMGVGISLGRLAGTVASFGAMGTISTVGIGFRDPEYRKDSLSANRRALAMEIEKARAIQNGKGILAVNVMTAIHQYKEMVEASCQFGIDAIVCGAGLPLDLPELVKNTDVLIAPIVSGRRALELIMRTWKKKSNRLPDFIVVEGAKAGGHLGFKESELEEGPKPLSMIVGEVCAFLEKMELSIPVFAAGGIKDKESMQEMIDQGASGIQVGTRFIATEECDASEAFKQKIVDANKAEEVLIKSPVGLMARALESPLIDKMRKGRIAPTSCTNCLKTCDPKTTRFCISDALMASANGDIENGLFFTGSGVDQIHEIQTVKRVLEYFTGEAL